MKQKSIMRLPQLIFLIAILLPIFANAQLSFEVLLVEGTAKVQRSQKRIWERVQIGQIINDNDLVETFFQTKLIMRFGGKNLVLLGSNSKALVNIVQGEKEGITNVNLTLFSGGLFSKAISDCHISIYTANAVGEIDSGSISAIAESKSGETGFQLLAGTAFVRNIAQQNGITLRAGLTTMILPNKEPTAPLYITHRHVAVLKHFFGDEYINTELEASGISPTEDQSGRTSFSKKLTKSAEYSDEGMHRNLFSINKIYGGIIDDRERNSKFYLPIEFPALLFSNKSQLHLSTDFAFTSVGVRSRYILSSSHKLGFLNAGLRFNIAQNSISGTQAGFNSLQGILDKISHLTIGNQADSVYLSLGPIKDYFLGYGLIVNRYSNNNCNSIYQPLGASGQIGLFKALKFKAFINDITLPLIGGAYLGFDPSIYHFGAGYYFDFDQFKQNTPKDAYRFSNQNTSTDGYPDQNKNHSNAQIYNLNFGTNVYSYHEFNFALRFEFAQKLFNGNDGYITRLPYFSLNIEKYSFGFGFIVQQGRLLSELFNNHYLDNRLRMKNAQNDEDVEEDDTLITLTNCLSKSRRTSGFEMTFNTNPVRGLDIRFNWQQDFSNKYSILLPIDTTKGKDAPGNFSLNLSARINDSLISFIKYGELFISQNHGITIPSGGGFFNSWDFEAGFFVLTRPLLLNMAFELGCTMFYFDMDSQLNNSVEPTDFIFELSGGVRWGFL